MPGRRLDGRPAASNNFPSRSTSARNRSASFAVRPINFVSSRASATLSRPASNCAFPRTGLGTGVDLRQTPLVRLGFDDLYTGFGLFGSLPLPLV